MGNSIAISNVRTNLPDLVTKVNKNLDRVTITVNGQPKAVLMSMEELASLEETLDILSNPKLLSEIKKAEKEIEEGKFVNLDQLTAELNLNV